MGRKLAGSWEGVGFGMKSKALCCMLGKTVVELTGRLRGSCTGTNPTSKLSADLLICSSHSPSPPYPVYSTVQVTTPPISRPCCQLTC